MATLVSVCGFECGAASTTGPTDHAAHIRSLSGAAVTFVTSGQRSGLRALRVNVTTNTASATTESLTSGQDWVARIYIYFASLPSASTGLLCTGTDNLGVWFKQSDSKLYAGASAASMGASGVSVTTGQWYCVDLKRTSTTVDVKVNGTACGQLSGLSNTARSSLNIGVIGGTATADVYFDDLLISRTVADYPLGAGHVISYIPNADGTHNVASTNDFERTLTGTDIDNATTDAYQLIDDRPLPFAASDFISVIAPPNSSDYVEWQYEDTTELGFPQAVDALFTHHDAGTGGTNNFTVTLRDHVGATSGDIWTGTTTVGATVTCRRTVFTTVPGTANAWTTTKFNALRSRLLSSDAAPDIYIDGAMLEVAFPESGSSTLTLNAWVKKNIASSFTVNAVVKKNISSSFTANAIVKKNISSSFTINAIVKVQRGAGTLVIDTFTASVNERLPNHTADFGGRWFGVSEDNGVRELDDIFMTQLFGDGSGGEDTYLNGRVAGDLDVVAKALELSNQDTIAIGRADSYTADRLGSNIRVLRSRTVLTTFPVTASSEPCWIRIRITGASPTRIRVREWRVGDAEPSVWDVDTTDNEAGFQTGVGRAAVMTAYEHALPFASIDDYTATDISGFTLDAVVKKNRTGSFTVDAIVKKNVTATLTLNAIVKKTLTGSFSLDAYVFVAANTTGSFTLDAIVKKTRTGTVTLDAIVKKTIVNGAVIPFPYAATTVTDDFNRAGEDPIGAPWDVTGNWTGSEAALSSNKFVGTFKDPYWDGGAFYGSPLTSNFEIVTELADFPDDAYSSLGLWMPNRSLNAIELVVTRTDSTVYLRAFGQDVASLTGSPPSSGDLLGLRRNGRVVQAWYKPVAGNWQMVGSYAHDADGEQMWPGMYTFSELSAPSLDNFRFAAYTAPPTLTVDAIVKASRSGSFVLDAVVKSTRTGSFTTDAVVKRSRSGSFTIDALARKNLAGSFAVDAWIKATRSATLTLDAIVKASRTSTFAANAIVRKNFSASATADAIVRANRTGSVTTDAIVRASRSTTATLNAIVRSSRTGSFSLDAWVRVSRGQAFALDAIAKAQLTRTFTADAIVRTSRTGSYTVNAIVRQSRSQTYVLDALVKATISGSFTLDAWVPGSGLEAFSLDAIVKASVSGSFSLDAITRVVRTSSFTLNAWVRVSRTASASLDAWVKANRTGSATLDAIVRARVTSTFTLNAIARTSRSSTFSLDAIVRSGRAGSFALDAIVRKNRSASATLDAWVRASRTGALTLNAIVKKSRAQSATLDALVRIHRTGSLSLDAWVRATRTATFAVSAIVKRSQAQNFALNAVVRRNQSGTFTVNAYVVVRHTQTFALDAIVRRARSGSTTLDAVVRATRTGGFTLNAYSITRSSALFTLDATVAVRVTRTLALDAIVLRTRSGSFSLNAIASITRSDEFIAEPVGATGLYAEAVEVSGIEAVAYAVTGIDAVPVKSRTGSFTLAAYVEVP